MNRPMNRLFRVMIAILTVVGLADAASAADAKVDTFLGKIKSSDANVRSAAWAEAGPVGAPAVAPLGELVGGKDFGVARAATEALRVIVHHAGRPGAAVERSAVEAALIPLLAQERSRKVRIEAADLLSFIGGDASVPALAGLLKDNDLREQAKRALERIPGDAATAALVEALADVEETFKPSIISALGQRRATGAVSALLDEIESSNRTIAMAAAGALSRIAETPTRDVDPSAFEDLSDAEQVHIANLFLRYADGRASKGDADAATEIYERILSEARAEHLECAAIVGLGRLGIGSLSWIMPQLSDGRATIRMVAHEALVGMPGPDVNTRLEGELATATPAVHAMLLRVLAARKAENAPKLLEEATQDENAEVRVTAYDLIGGLDSPALERAVLEAAEWGSAAIKEVALSSYLRMAGRYLKKGDKAKAGKMFTRGFDLATGNELRNEALTGIAAIADVGSLARVERAMTQPATAEAAGLAYVAIAARIGEKGDKKKAIEMITAAARTSVASTVLDAATDRLRSLGADVAKLAGQFGFVTDWWLVGPFPSPNKLAFGRKYFPEEKVDLKAGGKFGKKELKWKKLKVEAVPATIDLSKHFDPDSNVAAYGYAEINSPADREINLRIGTDDGCKVWLNGEQVHATNASRGFRLDQDTVAAKLKKGKNTILIKVLQGGGEWEMCVRVADRKNRPLDLTKGSS